MAHRRRATRRWFKHFHRWQRFRNTIAGVLNMRNRSWLNLFVLLLMCSNTVFAQRPTSLRGQVTDQLGAVIVGVSVTLTDANGKKTATQTDSSGAYRFDNLTGGVYTLTAQQNGFASETIAGLELSSGANAHVIARDPLLVDYDVQIDINGVSAGGQLPDPNRFLRD